jgi:CcmD family protein
VNRFLMALLISLVPATDLAAQATELGRQTLGRPYWHVFIAYAIAWLLIGGWVISIARRLARVERRLDGE